MIRKFKNIVCIYHDDKNYIPAQFNCPDLEIDDVLLNLTTNKEDNYEKIAKMIVDYAFALFCNKSGVSDFADNPAKFNRQNWKLLNFVDKTNSEDTSLIKSNDESKKKSKNEQHNS